MPYRVRPFRAANSKQHEPEQIHGLYRRFACGERELFPAWIESGLYGFATASAFIDIGTPESYAAADLFFGHLGHAA